MYNSYALVLCIIGIVIIGIVCTVKIISFTIYIFQINYVFYYLKKKKKWNKYVQFPFLLYIFIFLYLYIFVRYFYEFRNFV